MQIDALTNPLEGLPGYFDNNPEHNGRHHDRLGRRGQQRSCPSSKQRPISTTIRRRAFDACHACMQLHFGKTGKIPTRSNRHYCGGGAQILVVRSQEFWDMSDSHASGAQSFLTPRCSRSVRVGTPNPSLCCCA